MNDNGSVAKTTVDGANFEIEEQSPFNMGWWSFKKNGPAVRYEVAICIQTGWIVWINGPFPAGRYSDTKIACECGLLDNLQPGEKIIVDAGYKGHDHIFERSGLRNVYGSMKRSSRARHETINGRFKEFNILKNRFRHPLEKHGIVFGAIANIVQLSIQLGVHEPFQVNYNDSGLHA